ncbi:hypothetical protein M011DRAFT_424772 [Sporormia fimetaria CBS 119925]|uniref:Chalcone isomerase domain-containing protein n=1 Tax=Sporormia fimetaria CBS 119925 TaxID=1340428 RepID=A0A6A6VBL0_9PLEO|nr:hypothetical protein M011DRAFT_424772 [Sporormia fimetaria CBS 119925]
MNAARFIPRRPIFRCLNAPRIPTTPLRHYSRDPLPKSSLDGFLGAAPKRRRTRIEDDVSLYRAEAIRRAQLIRKRNWLALGCALSMIIPIILTQLYPIPTDDEKGDSTPQSQSSSKSSGTGVRADSPRGADEHFQGKKVVIAPGDKIIAAPENAEHPSVADPDTVELVETGTSYVPYFPKTIKLPTSSGPEAVEAEAEYTLLGLGIRKVSFLRVQVYVVGLYVKTSSLSALQNHLINTVNPSASALIPGEKDDLRKALLDPERSTQVWESILSKQGPEGVDMALRIVPTRGTDFNHLRDGLMRGIQGRTDEVARKQAEMLRQQAVESETIALPKPVQETEFQDESFGLAMKEFKAIFGGRGSAGKGSVLLLSRNAEGKLDVMYQPLKKTNKGEKVGNLERMGSVVDGRVSRLLWLLYLGGQNVSSEEARKNIVDGCIGIVERPVGTVESMVL